MGAVRPGANFRGVCRAGDSGSVAAPRGYLVVLTLPEVLLACESGCPVVIRRPAQLRVRSLRCVSSRFWAWLFMLSAASAGPLTRNAAPTAAMISRDLMHASIGSVRHGHR